MHARENEGKNERKGKEIGRDITLALFTFGNAQKRTIKQEERKGERTWTQARDKEGKKRAQEEDWNNSQYETWIHVGRNLAIFPRHSQLLCRTMEINVAHN